MVLQPEQIWFQPWQGEKAKPRCQTIHLSEAMGYCVSCREKFSILSDVRTEVDLSITIRISLRLQRLPFISTAKN